MRKKARHQELLDSEQKMKAMEKTEDLRRRRSNAVLRFLSIRQRMVNTAADESAYDATIKVLDEVVCSLSNLQYCIVGAQDGVRNDARQRSSDIDRVKDQDLDFVERVVRCYGSGAEKSVGMKAVGGANGIALSNDGTAFASVEVVLDSDETRLLVSSELRFRFAPGSDKIRSASWRTIREYFVPSKHANGLGNLCDQLVHPSVVSLEVVKHQDDEPQEDDTAAATCTESSTFGMSI